MPTDLYVLCSTSLLIGHRSECAYLVSVQCDNAVKAKDEADGHGVFLRDARGIDTLQHAPRLN